MQDIIPFNFSGHDVRTLADDKEQTWFVAADVSDVLEYRDASRLTRLLAEDEKGAHIVSTPGGNQRMAIINEPGLYRAIFASRSEKAEPFRRWVFHDVLPALRHTGQYIHEGSGIDRNLQSLSIRFADLMATYGHNRKKGLTDQEDKVARSFSRAMERAGLPRQFETKDGDLYVTPGLAEVIVEYISKGGKGGLSGHKDRALRHIKEHTHA